MDVGCWGTESGLEKRESFKGLRELQIKFLYLPFQSYFAIWLLLAIGDKYFLPACKQVNIKEVPACMMNLISYKEWSQVFNTLNKKK